MKGATMLSPIMLNALLTGGIISLLLGPLGCFVVWRRMAYFGDAVSHAALLGVALSLVTALPMLPAIFSVTLLMALSLALLMRDVRFQADTLLGFLAHGFLAVGVVMVSLSHASSIDMNAFLFGDILSVSRQEIIEIGLFVAVGLIVLWRYWHGLVLATLDAQLAQVEGHNTTRLNVVLVLLLAATVAIAIKIVGVLLITALLIMPAAAARPLAKSPLHMAVLAVLCGWLATGLGLSVALKIDSPAGPTVVIAAMVLCMITMLWSRLKKH